MHPGSLIRSQLERRGTSQSDFAHEIGVSFVRLNEIVNGRRGITADTALRLEEALGIPAEKWMEMQVAWELARARGEPRPAPAARPAPAKKPASPTRPAPARAPAPRATNPALTALTRVTELSRHAHPGPRTGTRFQRFAARVQRAAR